MFNNCTIMWKKWVEKGTALRNTYTLVGLHVLGVFYGISQVFLVMKIPYNLHFAAKKWKYSKYFNVMWEFRYRHMSLMSDVCL